MAKLEEIAHPGVRVRGIVHDEIVRVASAEFHGDHMLEVVYTTASGAPGQRLVDRSEAESMQVVEQGDEWTFDGDPAAFKLAAEARRIRLAHLFDPLLAVNGSLIDPYPHQIAAVYEEMLPRQPLRFLLADDPGAGKTIMAGLLIKELIARGDLDRCLVVAPGSLAEQWQEELWEKFRLEFQIINAQAINDDPDANPFLRADRAVVSLDRLKRDELRDKVIQKPWDLVIVDEAHKMSARYFGSELKKSQRYQLGEVLADPNVSRHFLLMTATPHNGKEEDFQAFMSLLDRERFYGKYRKDEHDGQRADDLMRRLVKEQMVKFDGTRLFPERRAETLGFTLSGPEEQLYDAVTTYVREEMGKAQEIAEGGDKRRGNFIGFALALLQRRLASSPAAIHQSLKRRKLRLETELGEARIHEHAKQAGELAIDRIFADDEMLADIEDDADDIEELEELAVQAGHAGRDVASLEWEVKQVTELEKLASQVVLAGTDSKWVALERLLKSDSMIDENGDRRKLIIFTEHKDTLEYLTDKIRRLLGSRDAVVTISGSTKREDRRNIQLSFRQNPDVKVLVATDAAGEGINLQNANLMVNYDLPWNPNRLEQRFGRIHRIGQTQVCYMWNLVATDTREGEVFKRLFDKLEQERKALGSDGVFDVLGEVFEGHDLRDLLLQAIQYGNQPEVQARIFEKVEGAVDQDHLNDLLARRAIAAGTFDDARLLQVKEKMERAIANRMQPHFIKSFFVAAFEDLGGRLHTRAHGRLEVTRVPAAIRQAAQRLGTRMLLDKYERICFDKADVNIQGEKFAEFVCPGHPLLDATVEAVLDKYRHLLKSGALLVDPTDDLLTPRALCLLEHAVTDGRETGAGKRVVSQRMQFVELDEEGGSWDAGPAPYLDMEVLDPEQRAKVLEAARGEWLGDDLEKAARSRAIISIAEPHKQFVLETRLPLIENTIAAVRERLTREINHYDAQAALAAERVAAGKPEGRMQQGKAEQIAEELRARLAQRMTDLELQRDIISQPPVVTGRALIVPVGLVRSVLGEDALPDAVIDEYAADPIARGRIEEAAMFAVTDIETELGREVKDVSAEKIGWDIEAWDPSRKNPPRLIEVKGRALGAETVTVTRNEALAALNKGDDFILAIVLVDGDDAEEVLYVPHPFTQDLDFHVTSVVCRIDKMRELAIDPRTLADPETRTAETV